MNRKFAAVAACLFCVYSCLSPYKNLHRIKGDIACVYQFKPLIHTASYKTKVDVEGRHITGILVFKMTPDSSMHINFANELGFKFFDFEFSRDSGFIVHYILKQMNRAALLLTLRKDFEMILFQHTEPEKGSIFADHQIHYYAFPQEKGTNYYLTDSSCSQLIRIEKSSKRKVVVQAIMQNYANGLPDTIGITHHNFNFTIGLKRTENHVTK